MKGEQWFAFIYNFNCPLFHRDVSSATELTPPKVRPLVISKSKDRWRDLQNKIIHRYE